MVRQPFLDLPTPWLLGVTPGVDSRGLSSDPGVTGMSGLARCSPSVAELAKVWTHLHRRALSLRDLGNQTPRDLAATLEMARAEELRRARPGRMFPSVTSYLYGGVCDGSFVVT